MVKIREFVEKHAPATNYMISLKEEMHLSPLDRKNDGWLKTAGKVAGLALHLVITVVAAIITVPTDIAINIGRGCKALFNRVSPVNIGRGCKALFNRVSPVEDDVKVLLPEELLGINASQDGVVCVDIMDPACPFSLTSGKLSADKTREDIIATMQTRSEKTPKRRSVLNIFRRRQKEATKDEAPKERVPCMLDALKAYTKNELGNTSIEIIIKTFKKYVEGDHMMGYLKRLIREDGTIAGLYFYGGSNDEERHIAELMTREINNELPAILGILNSKVFEDIDDGKLEEIKEKQAKNPYGFDIPPLMSRTSLVQVADVRPLSPVPSDSGTDSGSETGSETGAGMLQAVPGA